MCSWLRVEHIVFQLYDLFTLERAVIHHLESNQYTLEPAVTHHLESKQYTLERAVIHHLESNQYSHTYCIL